MRVKDVVSALNKGIPKSDSWIPEHYGPYNIKDYNAPVNKILYCVTATREVVDYFYNNGYDLLISHHPFVKPDVPQLVYHTALDCCPKGLNDMWRDALGVRDAFHFDKNLGWVGNIDSISFDDLLAKVETFIGHKIIGHQETDGQPIKSVVICTGLGGLVFREAEKTGADCYITGELTFADRGKFNSIIEVGHTLTEFIGAKYIQELLPDIQIDVAPLEMDYFGVETSIGRYKKKKSIGRYKKKKSSFDNLLAFCETPAPKRKKLLEISMFDDFDPYEDIEEELAEEDL
jgi:putative NIF3 family GTP cyclohydrolase 1 type 2